jgi:uncharacterized protein YutE (UPF0331/DUF86 family)
MTFLVERLAELRRHLAHLRELRPRVPDASLLERDLSLHNDVLFSLLTLCQLVIDIAGEMAGRHELPFDDYTQAVRSIAATLDLSPADRAELERLPGFRNVLVHEYVRLDLARVVAALDRLDAVERFATAVAQLERDR